jgi:hypothetical protein
MPQYLNDDGEPIAVPATAPAKVYLNDDGEPVQAKGIAPEARTAGNYASEIVRGVGRGIKGDVQGITQMVSHPFDTARGLVQQTGQAASAAAKEFQDTSAAPLGQRLGAAALTGLEQSPVIGGMVQHAEEGGERMGSPEAVGAAAEGITSFEAPGVVGKLAPRAGAAIARGVGGSGADAVAGLVEKTTKANETATAKAAEQTVKDQAAVDKANTKAAEKRAAEVQGHFKKVQEVRDQADAQSSVASRKAALETGVKTLSDKFQADLKTLRDKAKGEADAKYETLRQTLGEIPTDREFLPSALGDAASKIEGSQANPKIFKDILDRYKRGDAVQYQDLQGYYSELGVELSKGSLPGDLYKAYDTLQESIGNEMQRIADEKGMGQQLTDARTSWRQLKETFYSPKSPLKKALDAKEAGGSVKALVGKDRAAIEALAKFDPQLAQRANTLRGYQEEANGLRPSKTPPKPAPQLGPRPAPQAYPAPHTPQLGKIGTAEIEAAKGEALGKRADSLRNSSSKWATGFAALGAIQSLLKGNVGGAAMDVGARVAYGVGKNALASALESKAAREFLSKATQKDIDSIPPNLRGSMPQIIQAAKGRGVKISAALEKSTQGAALAPRDNRNATDAWANQ